jgi:hypothetical protein
MNNYLESVIKQFEYYKLLGEQAIAQAPEEKLFWQYNSESNSIAIIVNHMAGNMLSRWTDFLHSDGEKSWRNRDSEFENTLVKKEDVLKRWEEGWACLLNALRSLTTEDLSTIIYIRNQGHTVIEAINRQLAHYPYHVGQIVCIAKMVANQQWRSLSIPKGDSQKYNAEKFNTEKKRVHFTEEYIGRKTKEEKD